MKDDPIKIAVLAGTVRERRRSIHAARFVAETGKQLEGVEIRFADPKDFNFPGDGEDPESKDPKYTELTDWADAFFIITPEYNHGYPGSLKRMLDSEYSNYFHKAVALAGVSDGNWGGVRAIEALLPVLRTLRLVAISFDVQFPRVNDLFDDNGAIQDASVSERVLKAYEELVWMARALKRSRQP